MTDTQSTTTVLNAKQAAALVGVAEKTILRWIKEQNRLPAVKTQDGWQIDRADLERAAAGLPPVSDGQQPKFAPVIMETGQTASLGLRTRPTRESPEATITALANALSGAVAGPLVDRLERQAERIGQLEAQLAVATAPKPARPPRVKPAIPRFSVPLDPTAAAEALCRRFNSAELVQIAKMLNTS
jgi:excisionase family DNA binding protein